MCEYESEHLHQGRFVMSFEEVMNPEYRYQLEREFFPGRKAYAYHILMKDRDKFNEFLENINS